MRVVQVVVRPGGVHPGQATFGGPLTRGRQGPEGEGALPVIVQSAGAVFLARLLTRAGESSVAWRVWTRRVSERRRLWIIR